MGITVHHKPTNTSRLWRLRVWQAAWDGNNVWDTKATANGGLMDFQLPVVPDPRTCNLNFTRPIQQLEWTPGNRETLFGGFFWYRRLKCGPSIFRRECCTGIRLLRE